MPTQDTTTFQICCQSWIIASSYKNFPNGFEWKNPSSPNPSGGCSHTVNTLHNFTISISSVLYFVLFYSHLITHTLSRTHHSTTLLSLTLTLCSVIAVPRFSLHLETPSLPQSQPITILMAALALALLLLAFTGTSSMLFFQTPFLQSNTFFFFFFYSWNPFPFSIF